MTRVATHAPVRVPTRVGERIPRKRAVRRPVSLIAWLSVLALVFTLSGCNLFGSAGPAPSPGSAGPGRPDPEKVHIVAQSSNALAFDLLPRMSGSASDENVIIAPLSISALLAMLLEGAGGDTAAAIAGVLHLERTPDGVTPDGPLHGTTSGLGALLRYIVHSESDVELSVANAVWANIGYPLTESFVATMTTDFEAEVGELDLGSSQGADVIDRWVAEKTRDRIERMSDALGLPDPGAVIVLMNAVYFKGSWTSRFDPDATRPGTFTLTDGTEVSVPMMSQQGNFLVGGGPGFRMIRLPYGEDKRFVMEILLPGQTGPAVPNIAAFVAGLTPEAREAAAADLSEQSVRLVLPSFELEYEVDHQLDAVLKGLGMAIAYSPGSDFTPMSPRDPWLSRVAHKTYIRVDEEGSEAAGVTGAVMRESAPAELRVDRPFVFTITDTETGTILFMGVVVDPTG